MLSRNVHSPSGPCEGHSFIEVTEPGGRAADLLVAIAAALEDQMLAAIAVIRSREAPSPDGGFARITVPVENVGEAVETIQRVLR
jgi:hypothetical protein